MATDTVGFGFVFGLFRQIDVFIQHIFVMLVCGLDVWGFWTLTLSVASVGAIDGRAAVSSSTDSLITTHAERRRDGHARRSSSDDVIRDGYGSAHQRFNDGHIFV